MVDASERLQVILVQEEKNYKTSDYMTRMQGASEGNNAEKRASSSPMDESSPSPSKKRKSLSCLEEAFAEESSFQNGRNNDSQSNDDGDGSSTSQINKHWREKICEWAYQVVDHFDLNREVVSIAMNHLDRYLGVFQGTVDKNMFQLLAMTCLYLSIKLNEYKHLLIPGSKSSMDTILRLSRGFFTLEQMERMEYDILQRLQWHVHPPTPQIMVKHLLFFLSVEEHEVHDLAQFMVELSVMDYFFVSYKPSEVAIAALMNAMERLFPHSTAYLNFPFQNDLLDVCSPNVLACRERLSLIYIQANDQASNDGDRTPTKGATEQTINRTTSPVSVMAPPSPSPCHTAMETEYSDDEDL